MKLLSPLVALLSAGPDQGLRVSSRADCSALSCIAPGAAHIVVSRASTEAPGTGVLGQVADAVVAACPGSDVVSNPYPALLDPYVPSETAGVGNLTESTYFFSLSFLLLSLPSPSLLNFITTSRFSWSPDSPGSGGLYCGCWSYFLLFVLVGEGGEVPRKRMKKTLN